MDRGLFRKEVFEREKTALMGGISLAQPASLMLLSVVAVVVALGIGLYLTTGTYTRRVRVTGQLVPTQGLATILSPATGVVTQLGAGEGDKVDIGQLVTVVTVPRSTVANGETAEALSTRIMRRQAGVRSVQLARTEQLAAQEAGLKAQIQATTQELKTLESEIDTRATQVRLANETLDRLRQLEDQRYVSTIQIHQQETVALDHVGALQGLKRQSEGILRARAQLEQSLRELPGELEVANADYERASAQLEQERVEVDSRGALAVTATTTGFITAQHVRAGQSVQEGEPLLTMLPENGRLEAELMIPSHAVGFITLGDTVNLRYQAFPYQKFGHQLGEVIRLSRSAVPASRPHNNTGSNGDGESYYRVTVALHKQAVTAYGRNQPLMPGMELAADILGDRRRLIEWVFEPLYSLSGRVGES